jgi:hypothetical protein
MRALDLLTGEGGRLSMSPDAARADLDPAHEKARQRKRPRIRERLNPAEGEADRADRPLRLKMTARLCVYGRLDKTPIDVKSCWAMPT